MSIIAQRTHQENHELDRLHEFYCGLAASAERLEERQLQTAANRVWEKAEIAWNKYEAARERINAQVEERTAALKAIKAEAAKRQKQHETAAIANGRMSNYSTRYRAELMQFQRDVAAGRRPMPQPDPNQPF